MKTCAVILLAVAVSLPQAAHATDESALLAKEHFKRGTKLYNLGHYLEAAQEYEAAYQAKDSPALLYNLGQAYRAGGQPEKALTAYRAYLRNMPNAENRDEVMGFIDALRKTLEAQKQAKEKPPTDTLTPPPVEKPVVVRPEPTPPPTPIPTPVAPPRDTGPSPRTLKLAGIGTGVVGVASLALGATFAGLTASINHELNHPAAGAPAFDVSLERRGNTYQALETSFFVIGGAALVSGVVLYAVGARRAHALRTEITPSVGTHAAGAALRFAF
jgi:tetratricopeptide (TPR) repeat protein